MLFGTHCSHSFSDTAYYMYVSLTLVDTAEQSCMVEFPREFITRCYLSLWTQLCVWYAIMAKHIYVLFEPYFAS